MQDGEQLSDPLDCGMLEGGLGADSVCSVLATLLSLMKNPPPPPQGWQLPLETCLHEQYFGQV